MYDPITPEDFDFLTGDDKELMQKITAYSEKVIGDVKPEDMKMSERLDKLKPIMRKLALKRGVALERKHPHRLPDYLNLAVVSFTGKESYRQKHN